MLGKRCEDMRKRRATEKIDGGDASSVGFKH